MLIPITIAAVDRASQVLKGIGQSFTGLKNESNAAGQSAKQYGTSITGASVQASAGLKSVQNSIVNQTQSQQTLALRERERAASAQVSIAEMVVAERKRQHELKQTESALIQLRRAENQLESARARSATATRQYREHLKANDFLVGEVKKTAHQVGNVLPGEFLGLGGVAGRSLAGVTAGMTATTLAVGALTAGIGVALVGAFAAATSAANYFGSATQKAIDTQIEQVNASEPIVKNFKVSYEAADKYSRDMRERIARLGRDLPVSAAEIDAISRGIVDNLAPGIKASGKGLDELAKVQSTIASRAAILAQGANLGAAGVSQANLLINKLGSGTSVDALKQIQIVQDNPALQNALEDVFKRYRVKNSKNVKAAQMPQFILDIMNEAVSEEQIRRQSATVKSQFSAFTDKLFDPVDGLFGLERNLIKEANGTLKPDTSVFSEISRSVTLLLGENGTIAQISKLLGGTEDPMLNVYNALKGFNDWLTSVNKMLDQFTSSKERLARFQEMARPGLKSAETTLKAGWLATTGRPAEAAKVLFEGGKEAIAAIPAALPQQPQQPGQEPNNNAPKLPKPIDFVLRNAFPSFFAKPSFNGFMPLGSAIAAEVKSKPTNAGLLVANTSEFVLTSRQMNALTRPVNVSLPKVEATPRSMTVPNREALPRLSGANSAPSKAITIAPVFNISAPEGTNVKSLAQEVVSEIDRLYQAEVSATLT